MVIKAELRGTYIFVGDVKEVSKLLLGAYGAKKKWNMSGPDTYELEENDMELVILPDNRIECDSFFDQKVEEAKAELERTEPVNEVVDDAKC